MALGRTRSASSGCQPSVISASSKVSIVFCSTRGIRSLNAGHEVESPVPLDALARDDEGLETVERRHWLSRVLGSLNGRERSLLFLRLGAGRTRREAARELGLTAAQESRLFRRALDKARAVAAGLDGP